MLLPCLRCLTLSSSDWGSGFKNQRTSTKVLNHKYQQDNTLPTWLGHGGTSLVSTMSGHCLCLFFFQSSFSAPTNDNKCSITHSSLADGMEPNPHGNGLVYLKYRRCTTVFATTGGHTICSDLDIIRCANDRSRDPTIHVKIYMKHALNKGDLSQKKTVLKLLLHIALFPIFNKPFCHVGWVRRVCCSSVYVDTTDLPMFCLSM